MRCTLSDMTQNSNRFPERLLLQHVKNSHEPYAEQGTYVGALHSSRHLQHLTLFSQILNTRPQWPSFVFEM